MSLVNASACHSSNLVQPDGNRLDVTHIGTAMLSVRVDGTMPHIVALTDAHYAPELTRNLISFGKLMKQGCTMGKIGDMHAVIKDEEVVFYLKLQNDVLLVDFESKRVANAVQVNPSTTQRGSLLPKFVDHKSIYCRVFLAKSKDPAARKFEHFLVWFEKT